MKMECSYFWPKAKATNRVKKLERQMQKIILNASLGRIIMYNKYNKVVCLLAY